MSLFSTDESIMIIYSQVFDNNIIKTKIRHIIDEMINHVIR